MEHQIPAPNEKIVAIAKRLAVSSTDEEVKAVAAELVRIADGNFKLFQSLQAHAEEAAKQKGKPARAPFGI